MLVLHFIHNDDIESSLGAHRHLDKNLLANCR